MILFLLCCLLGISIYGYVHYPVVNNDHTENYIQEVESKHRDNLFVGDYMVDTSYEGKYVYGGVSELLSSDFILHFFYNIEGSNNIFNTGISYYDFFVTNTEASIVVDNPIGFYYLDSVPSLWVNDNDGHSHCVISYYDLNQASKIQIDLLNSPMSGQFKFQFTIWTDSDTEFVMSANCTYFDASHNFLSIDSVMFSKFYHGNGSSNISILDFRDFYFLYYVDSFIGLLPNSFYLNNNETYNQGYTIGYENGSAEGFARGNDNGYRSAETQYTTPGTSEYLSIYNVGKQNGLTEGYTQALDQGTTATTIFAGIISVGLLPINVFLQMLDLNVFGINIGGLISGLLTVAVVIIIVRFLFGGKNDK